MQLVKHALWLGVLAWGAVANVHAGEPAKSASGAKPSVRTTALPTRKPGLWEVTVRSDDLVLHRAGQPKPRPQTVRLCTDAAAEPVMLWAVVPGQEHCHEVTTRPRGAQQGGGWELRSVCFVHENRVEADMQLSGDLQTAFRGAYSVKYPATPMNDTGRMLVEGRWLGGCAAGQRAGDMVLPNGITVNVVDDKKRAESAGDHRH